VRRELSGGFALDDDKAALDRAEIHRFLSEESYWAHGRSRETVDALIDGAQRVVGLYDPEGRQAGFARTVSDGVGFAYLADVYVLPELRGRGLGLELVREAVERGPYAHCRWLLHTSNASELYAKVGFGPPDPTLKQRPAPPRS
jgi:ribosomal protein S18 acetylase RimI-like enzyme